MDSKYDVFLSYNSRDRSLVGRVAEALKERGIHPFFDRWFLTPGQLWQTELEQALEACRCAVIFISAHGLAPWQKREMAYALARHAKDPTFSVIPTLLPNSDPPLGLLSLHSRVDFRLQEDSALDLLAGAIRGEPPGAAMIRAAEDARSSICPYRGLNHFREEDSAFFYGHESVTATLIEVVEKRNIVALVGPSGSGKSSIARAGLLPYLRSPHSSASWEIAVMVPGDQPFNGLARQLVTYLEPEMSEVDQLVETRKLAEHLAAEPQALTDVIVRIKEKRSGADRFLLLIDQWEELYTLVEQDEVHSKFVDAVLAAVRRGLLKVVLTLRGDYFGRAMEQLDESLSPA